MIYKTCAPRTQERRIPLVFDRAFDETGLFDSSAKPLANIGENETQFLIEILVPGTDKEAFQIELLEDKLEIRLDKVPGTGEDGMRFTHKEFLIRPFVRRFRLPNNVNKEKIKANVELGILKITLPKLEIKETKDKRGIPIG